MFIYIIWCFSPPLLFAAREVRIYQQSKSLNIELEANGGLPNSGNWSHNLDAAAQAAISQATRGGIVVGASDVDYPVCAYPKAYCEHDELFVNGQSLGLLEGFNNATKATEKSIPASILQSTGASINFRVDVHDTSTAQYPSNWRVTISSSEIFVYANEEFDLSATPNSVSSDPNGTAEYEVSTDFLGVWNNPVNLSVSGLPAGATAGFTKTVLDQDGEKSTLTVTLNNTPVGTYPLTITGNGTADFEDSGNSKNVTRTANVNLVVEEEPGDFTLSTSPATRSIDQGSSTTYSVNVGFTGSWSDPVGLSVSGRPQGATAVFTPANLSQSGISILKITTNSNTPEGTHTLTITGSGGGVTKTATVKLVIGKVADYTLTASPATRSIDQGASTTYSVNIGFAGSWSDPVALSISGLPQGANAVFSPAVLNKSGQSSLTITTDTFTPEGVHSLIITGTGGGITKTATVNLIIGEVADFALSASPAEQTVLQGETADYEVTVTYGGSWDSPVSLSVESLPQGAGATFSPAVLNKSGQSSLTITTDTFTPEGVHPLIITGTGGGITKTATVNLIIGEVADFSLSASPAEQTVLRGETVDYEVTVTYGGSWDSPVSLSVEGLPENVSSTFTPGTLNQTGLSVFSIVTAETTPTGTYPLTITGQGNGVIQTVEATLVIEGGEFTLSVDPEEIEAEVGGFYAGVITAEFTGNCEGPVEIDIDGTLSRYIRDVTGIKDRDFERLDDPEVIAARLLQTELNAEGVNNDNATLEMKIGTQVPPGEYQVAVSGSGCDTEGTVTVTLIVEAVLLEIDKFQSHSTILPGQIQVYTISVTNTGEFPVTNLLVKDTLDSRLTFIKHTAPGETTADGQTRFFIITEPLASEETLRFQIHVKVDEKLKSGVVVSNTAGVTALESPVPTKSNTVTAITSFEPVAENALRVEKTLAGGRPKVGGILVYKIRVENRDQNGRVFDIRIDDRLPNGFKYVKGTSIMDGKKIGDPAGSRRLLWENLGVLPAGEDFTLKYRVVVGTNVKSGRNENTAAATGVDGGGNGISGEDSAIVSLGAGDLEELGEIKAMAFGDSNRNGFFDASDTPLNEVEFILVPPGLKQQTDSEGITVFSGLKANQYLLGLNIRKLSRDYKIKGDESELVRLLEGERGEVLFLLSTKGKVKIKIRKKRIKKF